MFEHENDKNLRVIKTARTEEAINEAAKEGFLPLVKEVIPNEEISNSISVYQHKTTKEIMVRGDFRWSPSPEEWEEVIGWTSYYPYSFPSPFAAYLVPADLKEGEEVWLEDIIEDIVAVYGNQGWYPRLEAYSATWKHGKFDIHFEPEKDAPHLLG